MSGNDAKPGHFKLWKNTHKDPKSTEERERRKPDYKGHGHDMNMVPCWADMWATVKEGKVTVISFQYRPKDQRGGGSGTGQPAGGGGGIRTADDGEVSFF